MRSSAGSCLPAAPLKQLHHPVLVTLPECFHRLVHVCQPLLSSNYTILSLLPYRTLPYSILPLAYSIGLHVRWRCSAIITRQGCTHETVPAYAIRVPEADRIAPAIAFDYVYATTCMRHWPPKACLLLTSCNNMVGRGRDPYHAYIDNTTEAATASRAACDSSTPQHLP